MSYEPREGVDYVIDLYALAGVDAQAEPDQLKRAINQRTAEYHPDRLQGLAPEFVSKGERMARLLNRARAILLDPAKRQEYDELLADWEGPISQDGTPVITTDRYLQTEMETKSAEEIEEIFLQQADQISSMTGYTPTRLKFLEKMFARSGDISDDLRTEYEDALLAYDRSLAIQEAERSRLLSLPDISKSGYTATPNYSETIEGEIKVAREVRREQARMLALGGVSTKLALLAGEAAAPSEDIALTDGNIYDLPAYFDQQAEKVKQIAAEREEVVKKRLANFQPTYPATELQTTATPNLAIGVGEEDLTWFGVAIDYAAGLAHTNVIADEVKALLDSQQYEAVIARGYNVLTFALLEQIDIQTLLFEAIDKHARKYGLDS